MDLPFRPKPPGPVPVTDWDPTQFFREESSSSSSSSSSSTRPSPYALLVLNHPINEKAYDVLQRHASIIVCADGGANRFYEMMKARGSEFTEFPTVIIGDLDSIHPDIRTHYESIGVPVIQHIDDYSTDFHKSLQYIRKHTKTILAADANTTPPTTTSTGQAAPATAPATAPAPAPAPAIVATTTNTEAKTPPHLEILVLGGLGGRVDQAFSQIHHLFYMTQELRATSPASEQSHQQETQAGKAGGGNLYLISEESITFVLQPGRNIVRTPGVNRPDAMEPKVGNGGSSLIGTTTSSAAAAAAGTGATRHLLEENVGIIPLLGPARITTTGFQWDVTDWKTEIGGQLSTSNHIRAERVEVETRMPLLLTLELAERFKKK
ncbi:thiamine diphosphokinase [Aspergillus saccharolyticus JOP 1030-1]|uniref:Thiamine pyrophosphokinase n=1 Tax=Aspergillus saccharolyticus JOP 1030-1 TaxID=1450539 RepID=A0A318ZWU2_9EURO|nr:thiamine pyrophosphokinase [Aspergillus saccharolyticus JOP 1030-1]PYH48783.1 thiamine pyrophosphokinase [Aspergillus saccharolyticus JOP 1030-1]